MGKIKSVQQRKRVSPHSTKQQKQSFQIKNGKVVLTENQRKYADKMFDHFKKLKLFIDENGVFYSDKEMSMVVSDNFIRCILRTDMDKYFLDKKEKNALVDLMIQSFKRFFVEKIKNESISHDESL